MAIIPKQKTIAEAFKEDGRTWARPLPFPYSKDAPTIDPTGSLTFNQYDPKYFRMAAGIPAETSQGPPAYFTPESILTTGQYTGPMSRLAPAYGETSLVARNPKILNGTAQDLKDEDKFATSEKRDMPNLRPAVDVLNYVLARRNINKIRDEQLARKNLYLPTPSLSVRPIQDLSPEVLAAQQEALAQNRSEYAGSDPAMSVIAKNIAAANRNKMRSEQIAGRAAAIAGERGRFDEQTRMNQQAAADIAGKNVEREQDFMDYRTGVKTAALDAKSKLNASTLSQLGMNIDTAAQYNMQSEAMKISNDRQAAEDMIKLAGLESTPEAVRQDLINKAKEILDTGAAQQYPVYGRAQAGAISRGPIGGILDRLLGSRNK